MQTAEAKSSLNETPQGRVTAASNRVEELAADVHHLCDLLLGERAPDGDGRGGVSPVRSGVMGHLEDTSDRSEAVASSVNERVRLALKRLGA